MQGFMVASDPRAEARVKDPIPIPTVCRYCGASVRLVHHSEVYGRSFGDWPYLYKCSRCEAQVGLHPRTNLPLGTLADRALRDARKQSKSVFFSLSERRGWSRNDAYRWLRKATGLDSADCHFGLFDLERCVTVAALCQGELDKPAA